MCGSIHNSILKVTDPTGMERKAMSKAGKAIFDVDDGGQGDPLLLTSSAQNYNKAKRTEAAGRRVSDYSFIHNKSVPDKSSQYRYKHRNNSLRIGN